MRMVTATLCLFITLALLGFVASDCNMACQQQCLNKMQQCQMAAFGQGGGSQPSTGGNHGNSPRYSTDMCANPPQDQCKSAEEAEICFGKLTECREVQAFKQTISMLESTKQQVCNPMVRCQIILQKCQCTVIGTGSAKTDPLGTICATYTNYTACMDTLPEECGQQSAISRNINFTRNMYDAYHNLLCDSAAGACPAAIKCLNQLSTKPPRPQNDGPPGLQLPLVEFSQFCSKLTVFDCLNTASSTCKLDQGSMSMIEIKQAASEMCSGTFGRTVSSLESCLECEKTFQNVQKVEPGLQGDNQQLPDREAIMQLANLIGRSSRTSFWCQYMQHLYQCVVEKAGTCSVPQDIVTMATTKNEALGEMCPVAAASAVERSTILLAVCVMMWAIFT